MKKWIQSSKLKHFDSQINSKLKRMKKALKHQTFSTRTISSQFKAMKNLLKKKLKALAITEESRIKKVSLLSY